MEDNHLKFTVAGLVHGNTLRRKPEIVRFASSLSYQHMEKLKATAAKTGLPMNRILMLGIDRMAEEFCNTSYEE